MADTHFQKTPKCLKSGARSRIRTNDLLITNQLLSQAIESAIKALPRLGSAKLLEVYSEFFSYNRSFYVLFGRF